MLQEREQTFTVRGAVFGLAALAVAAFWGPPGLAQEQLDIEDRSSALSNDELARELSNPNTPLASLTFKNTTTFFEGNLPGASNQSGNTLLFQPAFPFPLADDGTRNLFIRPAVPYLVNQPVFDSGRNAFVSRSGFGDIGFDMAVGQSFGSGLILVGGVQGTLPTGSQAFTGDQFRLGPEFVAAYLNPDGVLAAFPAHQWTLAGSGRQFSTSTLQIVAQKFLDGGWTAGTQPNFVYDWEGDQATVPVNLTVTKVVKFSNLPVQISGQFDYFVVHNDAFGSEYSFIIGFSPIVPNFIDALFR